MVELAFVLGFLAPCISLSVEAVNYRPDDKSIDFEISQKLIKNPEACGLKNVAGYSYKWIVVDKNSNQIDNKFSESLPMEVGLKNKFVINNQLLPKDFKPPLTFKVLK